MATPIRLKALLRRRHWQTYRTFKIEYDRAARRIDPGLVGTWPSRAQLHRWMSGELKGLPYPDHCRILEAMFPGWAAAQLFDPDPAPDGEHIDLPQPAAELWNRPDVAEALAQGNIGAVVRLYRKYTGASQTAISALIDIAQPQLDELEHGSRQLTAPDALDRLVAKLGIPAHLLDRGEQAQSTPVAAAAAGGVNYRAGETDIDDRVAASHHDWLRTRRLLNRHRMDLTRAVAQLYPEPIRLADTAILMPDAWRLSEPVDLGAVELAWQQHTPPPPVNGQHRETRALRPLAGAGQPYHRYSRAVRDLDRPRLFENRACYRLLDVERPAGDGGRLTLGDMCYFDMIDVGEALAHETALAAATVDGGIDPDHLTWDRLPFRRMLRDPFTLDTYPLMLSISTLTVRRSPAGTTFLMLRRNPAKVAIAGGMLSVIPTGVFQPASVIPAPNSPDFDLWRNMMREYSEEFLGNPEHDGDGPPIDYAHTEPFRSMHAARQAGKIRIWYLGTGIDALNYVGDVFTVAIFDADAFDQLFDGLVEDNDEGSVVTTDRERREFTFDQATIDRLLTNEPLAPSGAACLHLAWQHRAAILG